MELASNVEWRMLDEEPGLTEALVVCKQRSTHTNPGLCLCEWERAVNEGKISLAFLNSTSKTASRLQLNRYWTKGLDGESADNTLVIRKQGFVRARRRSRTCFRVALIFGTKSRGISLIYRTNLV